MLKNSISKQHLKPHMLQVNRDACSQTQTYCELLEDQTALRSSRSMMPFTLVVVWVSEKENMSASILQPLIASQKDSNNPHDTELVPCHTNWVVYYHHVVFFFSLAPNNFWCIYSKYCLRLHSQGVTVVWGSPADENGNSQSKAYLYDIVILHFFSVHDFLYHCCKMIWLCSNNIPFSFHKLIF